MSCADACVSHDYDGGGFSRQKLVRARKPYFCCECAKNITTGETHELSSGKSDGAMWRARTCAVCAEIRSTFVCGGWIHGELWESLYNDLFPVWRAAGPWDCLAKLTTQAAIDACNDGYRSWCGDDDNEPEPS